MLEKKLRVYKSIYKKIVESNKIAFISHIKPDLDTVWSATGFYEVVKNNFPEKKLWLYCFDKIPEKFNFIKNTWLYKNDFNPNDYDLIVFLDSWSKDQTWFDKIFPDLYDKKTYNTLNIDHHKTNQIYWRQNIINLTYSSTTMIVFEILLVNNLFISDEASTCFLAWIYTDTWWFKHSNVDKITFKIAWKLVELWWDFKKIVDNFFYKNKLSTIKLWWKIMKESFISKQEILFSFVNKSMIDSFWCDYDDIAWVVDYLNSVDWISYCSLLTQKWEYVKASLRTLREDIDLTKIAKKFYWWWHKKASWFTTKWKIEIDTNFKIVNF